MSDQEWADILSVPNLDGFADPEDLLTLHSVLSRLAEYADIKARAMRLRADGDIPKAQAFEAECDSLHARLPRWARW